jgi:hypothetical protein
VLGDRPRLAIRRAGERVARGEQRGIDPPDQRGERSVAGGFHERCVERDVRRVERVLPPAPVALGEHVDAGQVLGTGSGSAGNSCTSVRDCKLTPEGSDCMYACTGGICQLRGTTRTAGAGPCYGEILAQAATTLPVQSPPPVFLLCDAYAGLYCNRSTHVCEAPKKRGAACTEGAECGLDGSCVNGACAAAPKIGERCTPGQTSCGRDGFCDAQDQRCAARRANGQPCENLGEQCQSAFCGFAGTGSKQMVCMPRALERHCPEVP